MFLRLYVHDANKRIRHKRYPVLIFRRHVILRRNNLLLNIVDWKTKLRNTVLHERLKFLLLLLVAQEIVINIQIDKVINAVNTERERRLLLEVYKLRATTNVYLKIKLILTN